MKTLKLAGTILCLFIISNDSFAAFPADPNFPGPYICVHQNLPAAGVFQRQPKAYIYGVVQNAYERCPVFNENNSSYTTATDFEINTIFWDEEDFPISDEYNFREDPHDPSCRFGIIF